MEKYDAVVHSSIGISAMPAASSLRSTPLPGLPRFSGNRLRRYHTRARVAGYDDASDVARLPKWVARWGILK
jgi:hypothetical protein